MSSSKKNRARKWKIGRVCVFCNPGEEEELPPGGVPSLCFCPGLTVCRKGGGDQAKRAVSVARRVTWDLGRSRINRWRRVGEAERVSE